MEVTDKLKSSLKSAFEQENISAEGLDDLLESTPADSAAGQKLSQLDSLLADTGDSTSKQLPKLKQILKSKLFWLALGIQAALLIVLTTIFHLLPAGIPPLSETQGIGSYTIHLTEELNSQAYPDTDLDGNIELSLAQNEQLKVYAMAVKTDNEDAFNDVSQALKDKCDQGQVIFNQTNGEFNFTASRHNFFGVAHKVGHTVSIVAVEILDNSKSTVALAHAIIDNLEIHDIDYTINFRATGKKVGSATVKGGFYDAFIETDTPDAPEVEGQALVGWELAGTKLSQSSTDTHFSLREYQNSFKKSLDIKHCDFTVDAIYKPAYKLSFVDQDGKEIYSTNVVEGDSFDSSKVKFEPPAGYDFDGWDQETTDVKGPMTIKPKLTRLWTVTFNDGAGNVLNSYKVRNGEKSSEPMPPHRDGYDFKGWDANFDSVTSDMNIMAVWEKKASLAQLNAKKDAESYINTMPFSRKGLIHQLEYEGYSTEDATYAVDHITVDWNEQAARDAKSYLNTMSFSRSGLIHQLEFEGYTHDQAVYGVDQTGL